MKWCFSNKADRMKKGFSPRFRQRTVAHATAGLEDKNATTQQPDSALLTDDHLKSGAELLGADLIAADQPRADPGRRSVDHKVKRA